MKTTDLPSIVWTASEGTERVARFVDVGNCDRREHIELQTSAGICDLTPDGCSAGLSVYQITDRSHAACEVLAGIGIHA